MSRCILNVKAKLSGDVVLKISPGSIRVGVFLFAPVWRQYQNILVRTFLVNCGYRAGEKRENPKLLLKSERPGRWSWPVT